MLQHTPESLRQNHMAHCLGVAHSQGAGYFGCAVAAAVGAEGSGHEMPLAALGLALGPKSQPGEPNEGFYPSTEGSLCASPGALAS